MGSGAQGDSLSWDEGHNHEVKRGVFESLEGPFSMGTSEQETQHINLWEPFDQVPQTEWLNSGNLSSGSSGGWLAETKVSSGVGSFRGREGRICPGPSPPCVSSHGLPSVCVSVQISPFHEDISHVGLGVTLMNSPKLGYP